ncbi:MAG: BamA/TamA family outer membrane protein [Alistipes sp.]|nr:BamA/TamA family outer membrane protein [Alistipes sp.]
MSLRIIAIILLLTLTPALVGQAQEATCVRDGDTLHYNYTPLPAAADTTAAAAPAKRGNIFHRIVDYFGQSTVDRTFEKKIDFTFAGGPSYSKNTSLGIGLLAAGLYRVDRTDSVTQPSNVSIFASGSISGFYSIGVTGNNVWDHNGQRINYSVIFSSSPRDLWGIGYDAGRHNPELTYTEKRYRVEASYLYRILPGTYVGGLLDFQHTAGKKFPDSAFTEEYLGTAAAARYTTTGVGAVIEYDTRDFIPNPARGLYFSLQVTWFPKPLGSCDKSLWRTTFTGDWYRTLWKGGILATDLYAEFNSNGTPWPMLARMGGSYRMRGYYEGRYTDNDLITAQIELRQCIWRRIGCTVWAGAGNVFPELERFSWRQTLPNYGIGLRWELKKRVNIRLDYGFGKKTSGFMLNLNEAF